MLLLHLASVTALPQRLSGMLHCHTSYVVQFWTTILSVSRKPYRHAAWEMTGTQRLALHVSALSVVSPFSPPPPCCPLPFLSWTTFAFLYTDVLTGHHGQSRQPTSQLLHTRMPLLSISSTAPKNGYVLRDTMLPGSGGCSRIWIGASSSDEGSMLPDTSHSSVLSTTLCSSSVLTGLPHAAQHCECHLS